MTSPHSASRRLRSSDRYRLMMHARIHRLPYHCRRMFTDRLRMGPACYHVLHVLPPMVAHEMNFYVDEGLVDRNGRPCYDLVTGGLAPYGTEKVALAQAMKEK